jgi:hypothetical protein
VCAERVKVLHVAADDRVVGGVADDLVLDLLPALERLLNQDLGREGERLGRQVAELLLVVGKTRAETAEREGRAKDNRVADDSRRLERSVDGADRGRLSGGDVDLCRRAE